MDTDPDPRGDLTAAQRIAIALGTADPPPTPAPGADPAPSPEPGTTHDAETGSPA